MSPSIELDIDPALRAQLEKQFESRPGARIRLEVVASSGAGRIWVDVHLPGASHPLRMTLANALRFASEPTEAFSKASARLGDRPMPASVNELSGVVPSTERDPEAEYKAHILRKHSR